MYDEIIQKLIDSRTVAFSGESMNVEVGQGDLDEAIGLIERNGGSVTGTNDHEAGHTIYFEVNSDDT